MRVGTVCNTLIILAEAVSISLSGSFAEIKVWPKPQIAKIGSVVPEAFYNFINPTLP